MNRSCKSALHSQHKYKIFLLLVEIMQTSAIYLLHQRQKLVIFQPFLLMENEMTKELSTLERIFNCTAFAVCFVVGVVLLLAYFDCLTK